MPRHARWLPLYFLFATLLGCASNYQGPLKKNWDGSYFRNSHEEGKGFMDFVKVASGTFAEWPDWVENPPGVKPPERVHEGLRYSVITHATVLIQTNGINIITDPIFSDRASPVSFAGPKRVSAPGIAFEDLPPIDVILISHDHYDHLDVDTLLRLQSQGRDGPPPIVFAGLGVGAHLRSAGINRFRELDWGDQAEFGGSIITFVECQHRSGRGIFDHKTTLWGSFIVETPAAKIYFAGDTGYSPHFSQQRERYGAMDLAFLPIGAYEPRWFMKAVHMNPAEAVQAHMDLDAKLSVGIHFGTFQLTYEAIDDPASELAEALQANNLSAQSFRVPQFGAAINLADLVPTVAAQPVAFQAVPDQYREATELIDVGDPSIQAATQRVIADADSPRAKAIAIHDFVRDEVIFGWEPAFGLMKASDVLASGRGFCQTKTTLFVAMLRAAGIPARPRFAEIDQRVLFGYSVPGEYLDHSFAEVWLDDRWLQVDSFIADQQLFAQAAKRLAEEGRDFGYGIARSGQWQWDGRSHSFAQYVDDGRIRGREWPAYADAAAFYEYAHARHNNGIGQRLVFPWVYERVNEQVAAVRSAADTQATDSDIKLEERQSATLFTE